jgi:predicted MFS family arabinose efflux permease
MTHRTLFPSPVHQRLAPLIAASFFGGIALWVPVEKLFLAELGFTPQTIGIMAAAYAGVVPLLEIPSGILADRWSRRGVLLLGNAGVFLSVLVGALSFDVASYVVAAVLLGVYLAMQSGTLDSIVYDTVLEENGDSGAFESLLGRIRTLESVALVTGALAGGALAAATAPRVTYFATLPFIALSTVFLVAFREPHLHEAGESRSLRQHVAVTFGVLRRDRSLLPVVALMVLSATLMQAVFEFGPLWLVEAGAGAGAFGPQWAALMASLGLGGALAGRLRSDGAGTVRALGVVVAGAAAVLVVSHHTAVVTAAQVVVAMVAVILGIFLTRRLHDAVPSDVRTGVASGVGAATWATFLPFSLGFGAVSERWGVHTAGWLLVAIAVAIAGLIVATHRPCPETAVAEPVALRPAAIRPVAVPCGAVAA